MLAVHVRAHVCCIHKHQLLLTLHMQSVCFTALACPVGHFTGVFSYITGFGRIDCVVSGVCAWYRGSVIPVRCLAVPHVLKGVGASS